MIGARTLHGGRKAVNLNNRTFFLHGAPANDPRETREKIAFGTGNMNLKNRTFYVGV